MEKGFSVLPHSDFVLQLFELFKSLYVKMCTNQLKHIGYRYIKWLVDKHLKNKKREMKISTNKKRLFLAILLVARYVFSVANIIFAFLVAWPLLGQKVYVIMTSLLQVCIPSSSLLPTQPPHILNPCICWRIHMAFVTFVLKL